MRTLINLFCLIYSFHLVKQAKKNLKEDGELPRDYKYKVIFTEMFVSILAGAVYHYGWRKKFPKMASQATKYSIIIFGVECLAMIIVMLMFGPGIFF